MPKLNPAQRAAVEHVDSPLLVLAGAGSGKTRVITYKIAHLLGSVGLAPDQVAAVTFTNKAAREMKARVQRLLGGTDIQGLRVSTFHSLGLEILRREYARLDYRPGFTIFDSDDATTLLRELTRKEGAPDRDFIERVRQQISRWKNALCSPEQALAGAETDQELAAARLYEKYERNLRTYNAFDLDDLIVQPTRLLRDDAPTCAAWRERIRYLLVDEYQDTNACQYQLVRLLVGERGGLTAVGDDDQSIYAWRGAQPENLQLLSDDFPTLTVVKLEENYRSTGHILKTANHLIDHNEHLYPKRLFSRLGPGDPLRVLQCRNGDDEAERVVMELLAHRTRNGNRLRDYAILYRGNHQSRPFERMLREHGVAYRLSGGISFFERTEIKDLMGYLRLLVNPDDDAAFLRAVNTPRRGIGAGSLEKLTTLAGDQGVGLLEACFSADADRRLGAAGAQRLGAFARWVVETGDRAQRGDPVAVVRELVEDIGYAAWLREQSPEPQAAARRLANVEELLDWLARLARRAEDDPALDKLLAQMALLDALDREEDAEAGDAVHLSTLHAAKGLEFDHVFLTGMEETLLPHRNSLEDALDEERRLAYVGITRARRTLTFSLARERRRYGESVACEPSRFLAELPEECVVWEGTAPADPAERKTRGREHLARLRGLLAEPD